MPDQQVARLGQWILNVASSRESGSTFSQFAAPLTTVWWWKTNFG